MKTRHLFATAALASLFAACSQEELVPSVNTGSVSNRPVVGAVDIVSADDVVTRYNVENCTPVAEDAIGLYLMDEFNGYNLDNNQGELNNANRTRFEYQSNWWTMYKMVNYIQSNYGYEYMPDNGKWINRASQLVEGNYMVMFPKNDAATNRRDLWHEIKPVVDLKHHSTNTDKYYVGRDNQFMLDYQQVYRAQEADKDGNLTLSVKLRPILTYMKFVFENQAANQFIAEKLVFKAPAGASLPTVAYVRPNATLGNETEKRGVMPWLDEALDNQAVNNPKTLRDDCENIIATGLYEKEWFTQDVARDMVWYESTENRVPYGLKNTAVAYEYVFNFPNEGEGGVRLEGNSTCDKSLQGNDRVLTASIALPPFKGWTNMEVVVYGKMWDPTVKAYRNGVLKRMPNKDNAEFQLDQLRLWKSGMAIPVANVHFDDDYFYQQEEMRVSTTDDLIDLMLARLSNATTTNNIRFEVHPYGSGLEITDDVVKLMDEYEQKHGVTVGMTFKNDLTQGETPVVLKTTTSSINRFKYKNVNVVLATDQTAEGDDVKGIATLTNNAKLTIKGIEFSPAYLINSEGVGEIETYEGVTIKTKTLINYNIVKFGGNVTIEDTDEAATVHNFKKMTIVKDATVIINEALANVNGCLNCDRGKAVLTVNGSLEVSEIVNGYNPEGSDTFLGGKIVSNGKLSVDKSFLNEKTAEFITSGTANIKNLTNNGTVDVTAGTTTLTGNNANTGTISIAEGAEVDVLTEENSLANTGTINVSGDLMENIKNSGEIFVKGNGHLGVNGIVSGSGMANGIIDITDVNDNAQSREVKDMVAGEYTTGANYFRYRVRGKESANEIETLLSNRISGQNWMKNPIILVWDNNSPGKFKGTFNENTNVERVIVDREELVISGEAGFKELNALINAVGYRDVENTSGTMFTVTSATTMIIDNGVTITLVGENYNNETATIWVDGYMKFNNTSSAGGSVEAYGSGRFEFNNEASKYAGWTRSGGWEGQWNEINL